MFITTPAKHNQVKASSNQVKTVLGKFKANQGQSKSRQVRASQSKSRRMCYTRSIKTPKPWNAIEPMMSLSKLQRQFKKILTVAKTHSDRVCMQIYKDS
jgi:hypothetical protein